MERKRMMRGGRLCALLLLIFMTAVCGRAVYAAPARGAYSIELSTPAIGSVFELTGRRGLTLFSRSAQADENGKVRFEDLPAGKYRLAGNPVTIGPFLYLPGEAEFTLPAFDPVTGEELALLSITGKCSVTQKEGPAAPPSGNLPRTGVTWWVVPVLSGAGIVLIVIGWIRRSRPRKERPSAET